MTGIEEAGAFGLYTLATGVGVWYYGSKLGGALTSQNKAADPPPATPAQQTDAAKDAAKDLAPASASTACSTCPPPEDPREKDKKRQQEKRNRLEQKLDDIKEHTTDKDLDAARRELNGETVATKADGTPYDHVDEIRNSQTGLSNIINGANDSLGSPNLAPSEVAPTQELLSNASKALDRTEQFVPRLK